MIIIVEKGDVVDLDKSKDIGDMAGRTVKLIRKVKLSNKLWRVKCCDTNKEAVVHKSHMVLFE